MLTHHAPDTPVPGVTFVGDLEGGVAASRAAAGDRYVHVLGASVARQCLDAGVLDEILVYVAPAPLAVPRPGARAAQQFGLLPPWVMQLLPPTLPKPF
jgi:dihydrofolate reductase